MSQSETEGEERLEPQLEADEGTYRFIGDHALTLESGQPVGPGEFVTFDSKSDANKNKQHFEEGNFLPAEEPTAPAPAPTEEATEPSSRRGGS